MKKHNTLKVVLLTILILLVLTWLLPAAYFQTSYVSQGRVQMGLFDLFSYPIMAVSYFGNITIFVLVVGAFYAILNKIGVYRVILDKIVKKFKGKENILLSTLMVIIAVLVSFSGIQIPIIALFPFVIALVLLMGYDKLVAASTVVGASVVGLAGNTFAYNLSSVLVQSLSIKVTSEIYSKLVILVLGLVLLIYNTLAYAKKSKKDNKAKAKAKTTKVLFKIEDFVPEEVKVSKKTKVWPLVVILDLLLLVVVLSFISWSGAFNISLFDDVNTAVTGFKIAKFALFGKLLGTTTAFGSWTMNSIITVFIVAAALIGWIYKIKFDEFVQAVIDGSKRALKPAIIIILIYTCLVITTYHPFQLVIYKWLFGLTKGFNVVTTTFAAALAGLFNVEPMYAFQSAVPYLASLVNKTSYPVVAVIFQAMYGLIMLVAPTSVILMTVLSYLNISYKEWLKYIWKLLLELLVVFIIIFIVLVLI